MKMESCSDTAELYFLMARKTKSEFARIEDLVCEGLKLKYRDCFPAEKRPIPFEILFKYIKDGFISLITFVDLEFYEHEALDLMIEAAQWGDGFACSSLTSYYMKQGDTKKAIYYAEKGACQQTTDCIGDFLLLFDEPETDKFTAISYMRPVISFGTLSTLLKSHQTYTESVLYQFGRLYLEKTLSQGDPVPAHYQTAIHVYRESMTGARQAVFEIIMCLQRYGICKDMTRLIARYVWAQRFFWLEK
jgi:hypothetical protein